MIWVEGQKWKYWTRKNDDTSLDACKWPPTLEELENTASENSPASDNYVSGAKNGCMKEIKYWYN